MKRVEMHLAALAAAGVGVGVGAEQVEAAIVYSGVRNISVPATADGLYLNMVWGNTGTSGDTTTGWDVNPWVSGGTWRLFSRGSSGMWGGVMGANGAAFNLFSAGTDISQASSWIEGGVTTTIPTGTSVMLGIRLFNEKTSGVHFGWMRLANVNNPATSPVTIVDWAYESVQWAGIHTPFPPSPGAASALVIAGAGLGARRRRCVLAP